MTTDTDIKTEKLFVDTLFSKAIRNGDIKDVTVSDVKKLTGDASSRSYYRILTSGENYVGCLDQSLIKLKSKDKVEFYLAQNLLSQENVKVPKIYYMDIAKGFLLQEDLGDTTLLKHLSMIESIEEELSCYKNIISELISIHRIKGDDYTGTPFFKRSFDHEKLMFEVDFTIEHLIKGLFEGISSEDQVELIRSEFEKVVLDIEKQERVLTHRDFHSRNIMMKNGEIKIIDFQDMRMGTPQYDLTSLLEDCYYRVHENNKEELKKYYWNEAIKANVTAQDYEDFLSHYDKMAIQRTFKALGSFAYIYRKRNDIRYLKYIGYAFEQLRHILLKDPSFDKLRSTLSEIYYEY